MIVPAGVPESIAACADAIRAGALVGLPTETVYGLAADADNATAVAAIFAAKGRPADHPLIVHVSAHDGGISGVAHYCADVPPFAQQLIAAFWPGPLTLILARRAAVAAAAAGGQDSIGVRCPSHPAAQALLAALRHTAPGQQPVWGLAAPSANRFGRVSPTTAAHVQSELGAQLLVLDGGACDVGIESTIIDCTRGSPVLLRPGAITREQVEQVCARKLLTNEELQAQSLQAMQAPRASGTLESHYAPQARVRLMDAQALQTALELLRDAARQSTSNGGAVAPSIAVYARVGIKRVPEQVLLKRMPLDAASTAQQLFAALRAFDDAGVKLIWVETPPDTPDWEAVRDRLQRAAA